MLLDREVSLNQIRRGEVVVLKNRKSGEAIAHRMMRREKGGELSLKGDRVQVWDDFDPTWKFEGVISHRYQKGEWCPLQWRRLRWTLSLFGFYPGQRLPLWMSRSSLLGKHKQRDGKPKF